MPGWDTVATVAISSISTLSAAGLTHRFTSRRWREERADDRRLEQREAAVSLLAAGRLWATSATGLHMAMIGLRGDLESLGGTETADSHAEPLREMRRATIAARLTIIEPTVAKAVRDVSSLLDGTPHVMEEIAREARSTFGGPNEKAGQLMAQFNGAAQYAIDELERVALDAFSAAKVSTARRFSLRRPLWARVVGRGSGQG